MKTVLVLSLRSCVLARPAPLTAADVRFSGLISDLVAATLPSTEKEWEGPRGTLIDNVDVVQVPSEAPPEYRPMLQQLQQQLKSKGIRSHATLEYRSKSNPLSMVTIWIIVFETEARCKEYWMEKIAGPGWEKNYTPANAEDLYVLDGRQMKRRVTALGNVLLTSDNAVEGKQHLRTMELFRTEIAGHS